mgnify:CR=1 FL=1|tara:strand:+ start:177 stop:404 length:228 start_codon:yes stop_codon:yes gene_type:complete
MIEPNLSNCFDLLEEYYDIERDFLIESIGDISHSIHELTLDKEDLEYTLMELDARRHRQLQVEDNIREEIFDELD